MIVIKILYFIILFITIIYSLYFIVTTIVGAILYKKEEYKKSSKKNKFAILVPARNEEGTIGNLIDSLNKLDYPKDKYNIYIIPNNCTDKTAEISKKCGANVLTCKVKTKTKGEVLSWVFKELKNKKDIDAYVIFDADNIVHPDFLTHMNDCMNSGYNVAQGFRDAKNPSDNWISGSYAVYYLLQNVLFNKTRSFVGGQASLNGTGFMITKKYIDKKDFKTISLTEDMELTGMCALDDEKIAFVNDAITYDEYPTKFKTSWNQRKRWTAGILTCLKHYKKQLLKKRNRASIDIVLVYCGPLFQVLGFISCVLISIIALWGFKAELVKLFLLSTLIFTLATFIITIIGTIIVIKVQKKKLKPLLSGTIFFSVFVFTWIFVNIATIIKSPTKWEEIKHNRNINIDDILKK